MDDSSETRHSAQKHSISRHSAGQGQAWANLERLGNQDQVLENMHPAAPDSRIYDSVHADLPPSGPSAPPHPISRESEQCFCQVHWDRRWPAG